MLNAGGERMVLEIYQNHELLHTSPRLLNLVGMAHEMLGNYSQAKQYYTSAMQLFPNHPPSYLYAIRVSEILWEYPEARKVLAESLDKFPNDPWLLTAKAEFLLRDRNFAEGWKCWENRAVRRHLFDVNKDTPVWEGDDLNGRMLLVTSEQGLGDHIMLCRYLPDIARKGNAVFYLHKQHTSLTKLLRTVTTIPIITTPEQLAAIEKVDCWTSIGSLPYRLGGVTPYPKTYISADTERTCQYYQDHFNKEQNYTIGLCWKGSAANPRDTQRSFPFETFRPLLDVPGCTFYSLQLGEKESGLVNLTNYTTDFLDVTGMIANLDLVITVDTSVAHLAGAMGKEVWTLIGLNSDWRWGHRGESTKSIWYENDRLFWQRVHGDWTVVIQDVKDALMKKYGN